MKVPERSRDSILLRILDINWRREFEIHASKREALACIWRTVKYG
jgi:hypothetical protein